MAQMYHEIVNSIHTYLIRILFHPWQGKIGAKNQNQRWIRHIAILKHSPYQKSAKFGLQQIVRNYDEKTINLKYM